MLEPELDSEGFVNIWGTCFHRMVILDSDTAGSSILGMRIRIKDKGTSRSTCIPFPSVLNPHNNHPSTRGTNETHGAIHFHWDYGQFGFLAKSRSLSPSVFVCARDL